MAAFGYRNSFLKFFRFVHLPIFSVVSVVIGGQALRGLVPAWFAAEWIVGWIWIAYWVFWRMAHTVEVEGDIIRWWSALHKGETRMSDLTGNGKMFGLPMGFPTLRVRSGTSIIVAGQGSGWVRFLDELNAHHPDHPFRSTWTARMLARWPGAGFGCAFY